MVILMTCCARTQYHPSKLPHESSCLIQRRGNTGVISTDGQPVGWLRCNPQKAEKEGFRARRRLPISESLARDQRRHLLLLLSCSLPLRHFSCACL
ncbi:hypothetical protein BO85DRAFT_186945 [Aspergillus piperis CBS 112811]|uniref:Uncharacterized protein n=1 Tax=Aspergillus piperis CBS 112811 TaxID=1448313 RepID=A0A8G1RAW6_9EURO|nr:hypothetical protein BO85DRAFT_186945 [Aspergillus piperis CBS 112811]RAH61080.1 hypothetical protein BO85DRAFT_186945 [Aspergillus piperis CBS 112811]